MDEWPVEVGHKTRIQLHATNRTPSVSSDPGQQLGQVERAEMRGRPDARQLEQLGRVDGTRAQDHLALGTGIT